MIYTDKERLAALHNMPCIVCQLEDDLRGRHVEQPNRTTAHHLVDNGYRSLSGGHQSTLPMCEWHHLGYRHHDYDARYGTERQLLMKVNEKLEQVA